MPENDLKKTDSKTAEDIGSEIKAGEKLNPKVVSSDSSGLDMDTLKSAFTKLKEQYDAIADQLKAREQEDAETVRNVIIQKTKDWKKPFSAEELKGASLEDLDQLHLFIQRAPDAVPVTDSKIVEKVSDQISNKKARLYPKLTSDTKPYQSETHRFQIGSK